MPKKSRSLKKFKFFPILFFCIDAFARGGGGGGGHGGGGGGHSGGGGYGGGGYGGGSGGGFFLFDLLFRIFFQSGPVGWILLIVVIFLFFRYRNGLNLVETREDAPVYVQEKNVNPEFLQGESLLDFKNKVGTAFMNVQKSWSEKTLTLMRRFISDGVYQRFNAQFTMMNILRESNPITDVRIHDIRIVNTAQEPGYDCVDVAISASATDQFISEKYPQLNSPGGNESFIEYWSFIRRHDFKRSADIFHSELCPKCSAPLTGKLVESAQCPYCGTYLNSGEYDWVLSEITQSGDYGFKFQGAQENFKDPALVAKLDFSPHVLEDRASNAFMQILIAQLTQNTDVLKRFCTQSAYEFFEKSTPHVNAAYNRLYTQAVQVLRTKVNGNEIRAYVAIKFAYSVVFLDSGASGSQAEEDLNSDIKVLELFRIKSDAIAKGSVFANSCPNCGAAQKDNLSATCAYCQAPLNDPTLDWVVADMFDLKDLPANL